MGTISFDLSSIKDKIKDGQKQLTNDEYAILEKLLKASKHSHDLIHISNGFVRYRGMVQDMMDPEYVLLGDTLRESSAIPTEEIRERQPLLVVPIPFTSKWTWDVSNEDNFPVNKFSTKRERDKSEQESWLPNKRLNSRPSHNSTDLFYEDKMSNLTNARWSWPPGNMGSNPLDIPLVCHFYYDFHVGPKLLLNDIVEVIGLIEYPEENNLETENQSPDCDFLSETPVFDANEAFSKITTIPRLHAIYHRKLDFDELYQGGNATKFTLVPRLTEMLGSQVSAEAIWISLFSKAERRGNDTICDTNLHPIRTPFGSTLGCASLNLLCLTTEVCHTVGAALYSLLQSVFPVVARINLKGKFLAPPIKKGPHLLPSQLQLPQGAVIIVVDDRNEDELDTNGLVEVLQSMVSHHVIPYGFDGGIHVNFEADYRILVLSPLTQRQDHYLPCTLTMTLRHEPNLPFDCSLQDKDARDIRSFISRSRRNNTSLGQEVLTIAQHDFVDRRQASRDHDMKRLDGEEDFHRWLTITRLWARSEGRCEATEDDWKNALCLDDNMRNA
jgi:Mini-chromosome maintenance replisome factor